MNANENLRIEISLEIFHRLADRFAFPFKLQNGVIGARFDVANVGGAVQNDALVFFDGDPFERLLFFAIRQIFEQAAVFYNLRRQRFNKNMIFGAIEHFGETLAGERF